MIDAVAFPKRPCCLYWSEIEKWTSTSSLLRFGKLPAGWRLLPVHEFATQIDKKERVDPETEYKMAGVKWYGEGVFHRETVVGKEQSAKYLYPLEPGAIIYNRLFAWKESFAVVSEDFTEFYVSNEFPQFEINEVIALSEYVYLLFTSKKVIKAVNAVSIGSAAISRNRLKESEFLGFEVPIPPLPVQQKIVAYWEDVQSRILVAARTIETIQQETEKELLKKIGLQVPPITPRKGRFTINLSQNERWDTFFFREDFSCLDEQIRSFKYMTLGDALNFINRRWKLSGFPNGSFEYIEISSVTKNDGVTNTRRVSVEEAPSRATTLVKAGDLIISTTRPYLGAFAIIQDKHDGFVCSSGFSLADSLKTTVLTKEFILFFLKSPAGLRQLERRMSGGLYPAIVQSELEKILIPTPPLTIQKEVVAAYKNGLEKIHRLRKESEEIKARAVARIEQMILGTRSVEAS